MRKPTRVAHPPTIHNARLHLQRNFRRTAYLRHLSYQVGPALDQIEQFSPTDWCLCERCHTKSLRKFIGLHACDSILILYGPLKREETNLKTINLSSLFSPIRQNMNHFFFYTENSWDFNDFKQLFTQQCKQITRWEGIRICNFPHSFVQLKF